MLDEFLLNTKFSRWAFSKILKRKLKERFDVDSSIILKKMNIRSDEKMFVIEADTKIILTRENAEQLIRKLLEEGP